MFNINKIGKANRIISAIMRHGNRRIGTPARLMAMITGMIRSGSIEADNSPGPRRRLGSWCPGAGPGQAQRGTMGARNRAL